MFRHAQQDTPRGRALQSFSNVFLHLYPVKIPKRVLRIRYSFRLGFIAAVLFSILLITGMPQKWPSADVSRWVIDHIGGIFAARWMRPF